MTFGSIFTFIIRTPIFCCTTTDLGIFGIFLYCSRDFCSCVCESPAPLLFGGGDDEPVFLAAVKLKG